MIRFLPTFLVLALISTSLAAAERPNFIYILADDAGWGDFGCYGQQKIRTPNVDKLAAAGMRFTDFYCGNAVCAPSRCALLTGLHSGHGAVRDNREIAGKEGQQPLPPDTVTSAQLLKKAGYATGLIGKWGLGMPEDHSAPSDFGFDDYYGYLCQRVAHTYYPPYLWRNGVKEILAGNPQVSPWDLKGPISPAGKTWSHTLVADESLRWVRAHKDGPFFLHLAFTIPHLSQQVPEDVLAEYRGAFPETPYDGSKHYAAQATPHAAYAAMITRMDRDIGRLLDLLRELKLEENTVVFFASDNGAMDKICGLDVPFFKSNGPFRGGKQELYEGGIRSPFVVRWPGHIKAGTVSDHAGAFWDVPATLCELAGAPAPVGDGLSFAPALLGHAQARHPFLYWEYHSAGGTQAVRLSGKEGWKGVRHDIKKNAASPIELYSLLADEGEKHDVAADHPDVVGRVREIMAKEHTASAVAPWNFPPIGE
ncbi:MAG TPA: arylsulfatase [Chthoniobacteraceae bacterium]|nr:arylsulfatase [Chthoniobacteraceae bacterium]